MKSSRDERSVRFQDWSSERSLSSEAILSGRERSDSYAVNNPPREFGKRSEKFDSFYPRQSANDNAFEEPQTRSKVLDPQDPFLQKWNKIFVLACVLAVSVDPLFYYIPSVDEKKECISLDRNLQIVASVLRTFTDVFYVVHIIFQFNTGFIAPSSRVFGRGVLVEDIKDISMRYLSSHFIVDLLAVLPLPQIIVLISVKGGMSAPSAKDALKYIIFLQYIPRVYRIWPLYREVTRSAGIITETAWAGAVFNLLLYMLASHVFGALWYLLSIEREDACWRSACGKNSTCYDSLYCGTNHFLDTDALNRSCPIKDKNSTIFDFGMYLPALQNVAKSTDFLEKFFYCFWFGLKSLSSLGQGLETSTYVWENLFAVSVAISGLVLFALLIGNMQTYLQSTTVRIEEMRVKRQDAEQWMVHRLLPENLRERIRKHEQYRWQETRGVNEEQLLSNLPKDLRRDIKRHLCLALLTRVPMFEKMDDQLMDAMCDRLKPVLYTEKSVIIRELDPVNEMLFVMRGKLNSVTTQGGRSGFFNADILKAGDFCGEELLTWALDPQSSSNLPLSTRTVEAVTEVEAFALVADDLKFVASQFRRLHSKQLRHTFRFYSPQWRTWAACFLQAAWRRYSRRKMEESLREEENRLQAALAKETGSSPSLGATIYASRFAVNALKALRRNGTRKRLQERVPVMPLQKPPEPDFTSGE